MEFDFDYSVVEELEVSSNLQDSSSTSFGGCEN